MKISVIIPVRNEEDSIDALLSRLLKQTLLPDEIVITDGGSRDGTTSIIQGYIDRGAPVHLIHTNGALPGRGRNLAAAHSTGDWLAFTDGGIRPEPTWLEALAEKAETEQADVVYGTWEPVIDSFFKECAAIAYVAPPIQVDGRPLRPRFIASALMRRCVWEKVGGFPEHLRSAEDLLFMDDIENAKYQIVRSPAALVRWQMQPTLWRTFRRFAIYARHNIRAGLWRQWQAAIFRRYALIILIALPAIFVGVKWLIVPLLLWLALMIARAVRALRQNRHSYPAGIFRNSVRLLLLVPIIAMLDAAAFIGSINWLLRDKFRVTGSRGDDDSLE
jgi:glycosyltransferase involved in cell wall biosynthesis